MLKKKNLLLASAVLLALGSMNGAYAGAGLDCTSVATIASSNDTAGVAGASNGLGTVTADQVIACAIKVQGKPEELAALGLLVSEDGAGAGGDDLKALAEASLKSKGTSALAAKALFLTLLDSNVIGTLSTETRNKIVAAVQGVSGNLVLADIGEGNAIDGILIALKKAGLLGLVGLANDIVAKVDTLIADEVMPVVSRNNLGQTLIYPYYTTLGTKETLINVFNTSGKTIATKIRFHEAHNSRDVMDFTVVLSPYDKWSGTIKNKGQGVKFYTNDSTCTVPAVPTDGIALRASAYNGVGLGADSIIKDAGDQGLDRLNEGYVEVIAMGEGTADFATVNGVITGNIPYYAKHIKDTPVIGKTTPRDCAKVRAAFAPSQFAINTVEAIKEGSLTPFAFAAVQSGLPTAIFDFGKMESNPLRGALVIVDQANGVGFGTNAVAIANFNDSPNNLITAQAEPFFHEPSTASRNGLWTSSGLADIEKALAAGTIANEWANNPKNGANVDWVVQFPTKSFHVDCGVDSPRNFQSGVNQYRKNTPICTLGQHAPFSTPFGAKGSPVLIDMSIYDKEENAIVSNKTPTVSFSPNNVPGEKVLALPWETNVITFSGTATGSKSVLSSTVADLRLDPVNTVNTATGTKFLTENNGLALMNFLDKKAYIAALAAGNVNAMPKGFLMDLPVVGFAVKQRDQGDATKAYGQMMDHAYIGRSD